MRAGTAEGAIEHVPARGLVMHSLLVLDGQCAGLDQDAALNLRGCQALRPQHHGVQGGHTGQGGDDDGRGLSHRLGRGRWRAPRGHKHLHALGGHIKANDLKSCGQQVGRHGTAHDAQAHQAHGLRRC